MRYYKLSRVAVSDWSEPVFGTARQNTAAVCEGQRVTGTKNHHRDAWDAEACDPYIGSGSLHSNDSGFNADPVVVRSRPIGFLADVDQKPVYRVKAGKRECK